MRISRLPHGHLGSLSARGALRMGSASFNPVLPGRIRDRKNSRAHALHGAGKPHSPGPRHLALFAHGRKAGMDALSRARHQMVEAVFRRLGYRDAELEKILKEI